MGFGRFIDRKVLKPLLGSGKTARKIRNVQRYIANPVRKLERHGARKHSGFDPLYPVAKFVHHVDLPVNYRRISRMLGAAATRQASNLSSVHNAKSYASASGNYNLDYSYKPLSERL